MQGLLDFLYKFRWHVLVGLLVTIGVSVFLGFDLRNQVQELISQQKENERPAEISLVRITAPECSQCQQIMQSLERNFTGQLNIKLISQKDVAFGAREAQDLIEQFQIQGVPALVLRGEIEKTDQLKQAFSALGKRAGDSLVVSAVLPPYLEVETNTIIGEFKVTYLTDESCAQCYDVNVHTNILASFGMFPFEEIRIDRESKKGRQLISQYKITKTPTILLQGDLQPYGRLQQVWRNVGRVSDDSTYIFEAVDQMGTYRDLAQDEIVELNQQQNQQAVHRHVNFLVLLNGEQFDFAADANRYFVKDQRAHLEGSTLEGAAGKVIHVHDEGINLQDFFGTLNWQLRESCITTDQGEKLCSQGEQTLKVFRSGEQDSSFGGQELQDGDQYLVTFGSEDELAVRQQIKQVPNFAF